MLGVLGVLLVGLSAVYLYFRHDDYAMLRELIRRQALASLGSELALKGPIDVEVGEDARIFLRNITLTNPKPGFLRSVIAIREARISLPAHKAVSGDLSAAVIDLFGVDVEVARDGTDGPLPDAPTDLEAAALAHGVDLPPFDRIRAHDVAVIFKGLLGDSVRTLDFALVSLKRYRTGGFRAEMHGAPHGLAATAVVEARPLDEAAPGALWRAHMRFGGSDVAAVAELRAARRLFVRAGIEADHIAIDDVAALFGPARPKAPNGAPPLLRRDDRLPIAWLGILDATLHINVARISWGDDVAEALALHGRLERGRLVLSPARLKLGDGGIELSVRLDAASLPAALALSAVAQRASVMSADRLFGAAGPWWGEAEGSLQATARGETLGALARLAGQVSLRVRYGEVDAAAHDLIGHASFARLFHADARTPVPCMALEGRFADGAFQIGNATLVTALGRLAAEGSVDWQSGHLDLRFVTAPDAGPERLTTRRTHLSGTLAAPRWREETLAQRWLALARPSAACVAAAVAPR